MAKTKYKKQYAEDLLTYFFKFIEMRADPKEADLYESHGLYLTEPDVDDVYKRIPPKPATGYPTLTKFAIMKGVTPRTLSNWRQKYKDFDEACAFADAIQDDILNERALFGKIDGKVAMKIRELKAAARKDGVDESGSLGGRKYSIDITRHVPKEGGIEIKEWNGEVAEDEDYKPKSD